MGRISIPSIGQDFFLLLVSFYGLPFLADRQHFHFKASTKGYVVNSCLAPPLNPDGEAVSHSPTCSNNLLSVSWGAVMLVRLIINTGVNHIGIVNESSANLRRGCWIHGIGG